MAAAAERGFPAVTEAAVRASRCCRGRCSPVGAEQIYNEALVVGLVDTGVGMDAERGYVWGGEALGGVVVGTEAAAERTILAEIPARDWFTYSRWIEHVRSRSSW